MPSIAIDRLDGLSSATAMKGPCRVATTGNITLSGEQIIDGVAVVTGDRVLVKSQTDATTNGIYVADTGSWARAKDFSRNRDVQKGTRVYVTDGSGGGEYAVASANPIQVGTSDIEFSEVLPSIGESVVDYGAVADASTDNTAAVAAAFAHADVIYFPPSELGYLKSGNGFTDGDPFPRTQYRGTGFPEVRDAKGPRWSYGNKDTPASEAHPTLWAEKVSELDRDATYPNAWDFGAGYFTYTKVGGGAPAAALTGYARLETTDDVELIGIRGDASGQMANPTAAVYGVWATASEWAEIGRLEGLEINIANYVRDRTWDGNDGAGDGNGSHSTAMVINNTSGLYPITTAIRIRGSTQKFWTGLQFVTDAIMPIDANGNGEAIRIRGGSTSGNKYGGIALGDASGSHNFEYGLRTKDATFTGNAAVWMARNQRLVWGTTPSTTSFVTVDSTEQRLQLGSGITGFRALQASFNFETGQTSGNAILFRAYDVDGAAYQTFATLTAGNTPTFDLSDAVTKEGQYIYRGGGTDVPVTDGGTGASTERGAAANLGTWHVLAKSGVAVPLTGSTSETALATVAIPAGAMGPNGVLRVTTLWSLTNSANNKTPRVRLGGISGTAFRGQNLTTVASGRDQIEIHNRNAQNSQVSNPAGGGFGGAGTSSSVITTATVDTSIAQDLVISGQLANSGETLTLEAYTVEVLYGA